MVTSQFLGASSQGWRQNPLEKTAHCMEKENIASFPPSLIPYEMTGGLSGSNVKINVERIGDSAMTVKSSNLLRRFGTQLLFSLSIDYNRPFCGWDQVGEGSGGSGCCSPSQRRILKQFICGFIRRPTEERRKVVFLIQALCLKSTFIINQIPILTVTAQFYNQLSHASAMAACFEQNRVVRVSVVLWFESCSRARETRVHIPTWP